MNRKEKNRARKQNAQAKKLKERNAAGAEAFRHSPDIQCPLPIDMDGPYPYKDWSRFKAEYVSKNLLATLHVYANVTLS